MAPGALAYVGDGVWELHVRAKACRTDSAMRPAQLYETTRRMVQAEAQARALPTLELSHTEQEVARWGGNATLGSVPRRLRAKEGIAVYRAATGFEALLGWLYMTDQRERLDEVMENAVGALDAAE